ncbi:MAG: class I SAM-dependent methyltransferase [Beijerinckiaceae bacterium]
MNDPRNLFGDGSAYERSMGRWSQPVGAIFLDWLDVPQGLEWLDAGCGNGAFTEVVIRTCAPSRTEGIDPSESQIAYARTRQGCAQAHFQTGDAQAIPYPDASFDAAVMALVISFIPDPAKAVAELKRVVRPGGCTGTYMWDNSGDSHPAHPINTALRQLGIARQGAAHSGAARLERLQELWEGAGHADVATRKIEIPVTFSGFDDFWQSNEISTGPLGASLRALSSDAREALKAKLQENLPAAPDGSISYRAYANAVKGRIPA